MRKIGKIATQGRNTTHAQYVKNYRITYSTLGSIFVGIRDINLDEVVSLFAFIKCPSSYARCDWSVRVHYNSIKHAAYVTRLLYRVIMHAAYVTSLNARYFLSIL